MDSLNELLKQKVIKNKPKRQYWQEVALNIIEYTHCLKKNQSAVFRTCKKNIGCSERAFSTCKELSKPFVEYYFKVFNEYNKQYDNKNTSNENKRIER